MLPIGTIIQPTGHLRQEDHLRQKDHLRHLRQEVGFLRYVFFLCSFFCYISSFRNQDILSAGKV